MQPKGSGAEEGNDRLDGPVGSKTRSLDESLLNESIKEAQSLHR
jgi:hypothetical protein